MKSLRLAAISLLCLTLFCVRPGFADETVPSHLGTIPFEGSASGDIIFNPNDSRLYVTNGTPNLLVIDPDRQAVVKSIPLPLNGGQMALNEKSNAIYVLGNGTGQFVKVNCDDGTVSNAVTITPNPVSDIAYNPTRNRVYVSAVDKVRSYDGGNLGLDETIAIGSERNPRAEMMAVDSQSNKIFCILGGQARLAVIDGDLDVQTGQVPLKRVPRAIACLPALKRLFVSSDDGYITVYDTSTGAIRAEIKVISAVGGFTGAGRFAGDARAKKLFFDGGGIALIDLNTNTQVSSVSAGNSAYGVAFDAKAGRVFDVGEGSERDKQVLCLSYGKSKETLEVKGRLFKWVPDPKKPSALVPQGVANVPVRISAYKGLPRHRTVFSDKDGNYAVHVSAGSYSVTPFLGGDNGLADNFDPIEALCEVKTKDVAQDFVTYSIGGRLTRSDGSALSNAKVALTRPGREDVIATSDMNGNYSFDNLGPGTYTLIPFAPEGQNFAVRQAVCTLPMTPSPNAQADFRLGP